VDWLRDFVGQIIDTTVGSIGRQWTLVLVVALIALAIFLILNRSKGT
jgi:hypothetical protein